MYDIVNQNWLVVLFESYVHNTETKLYYLQSRYYDPDIGRFINADAFASTGQGILGNNMFAYCCNSPILWVDPHGYVAMVCIGAETEVLSAPWKELKVAIPPRNSLTPHNTNTIDITNRLNIAMIENAVTLYIIEKKYGKYQAVIYFINAVKFGGEWDLKHPDNWNLIPSVTYVYNGMELRFDDIGNIHYGFVGRVIFEEEILRIGAGLNQIIDKTSSFSYIFSYFDDPRDQIAIGIGFRLWEEGLQWAE